MKTNIWEVSRSEPGLHVKRAGNVKNGSYAIGVPNPSNGVAATKRIVLGSNNQGSSDLKAIVKAKVKN